LDAGHQLLVRVGSNVKLLKKLGYARERNGLVYLWPDRAAKKRLPPLVLRLTRLLQFDFVSIIPTRVYNDANASWHHAVIGIRGAAPFTPRFSVCSWESRPQRRETQRRS